MQKIAPFLWFDTQAEEAVNHYLKVFKDGRILTILRYTKAGPGPEGTVMLIVFEIGGTRICALNGGPIFTFNEAISLVIDCADQGEVDALYDGLGEGGTISQCGWLTDRFGVTWQLVPLQLQALMREGEPEKLARMTAVLYTMKKIDIARLQAAYDGR